jgi:hypothetical protein
MSTWRCGWTCPRSYFFAAVFLAGASFAVLLAGAFLAGVPLPRFTCGRTMKWTSAPTARSAV